MPLTPVSPASRKEWGGHSLETYYVQHSDHWNPRSMTGRWAGLRLPWNHEKSFVGNEVFFEQVHMWVVHQRLWRGKAKPTKASGLSERIPRGFIPEGASTSCHADEMAPHANVLVKARLMNLAIPNVVVHIQSCKDTRKCGKRKENKTRRTTDRMVGCGEGRGWASSQNPLISNSQFIKSGPWNLQIWFLSLFIHC